MQSSFMAKNNYSKEKLLIKIYIFFIYFKLVKIRIKELKK